MIGTVATHSNLGFKLSAGILNLFELFGVFFELPIFSSVDADSAVMATLAAIGFRGSGGRDPGPLIHDSFRANCKLKVQNT
jgi:hypothetical protein